MAQRQNTKPVRFVAPTGGINTVDPSTDLGARDAAYAYNVIPGEGGLRARLGYREWCTGLTGATDNTVRSKLAFSGGRQGGSTDKLFACTSSGIWDVTASSTSPTRVVTFGIQTGNAGWGIPTVVATPAGRFLFYCDEENGLYVYSEASTTWAKVALGAAQLWAASTGYLVGNQVVNGGKVYIVTAPGTSAGSGGPTGTGTGIVDGTVTWNYVGASSATAIGPSLADQQNGFAGDPASFCFVTVWKSRVWLVEKDSSRAWYLGINSIYGVATSFDFGSKMRAGGPLVGLYGWSYDGGNGLDTLLAGLSSAGDVVIYQGTDPASASTFGLKGTWSVGGVPAGRRIATEYGGDVLIYSLIGLQKLSDLVVGQPVVAGDRSQYVTAKVANLVNVVTSASRTLLGWAMYLHPTDNALLLTQPTQLGQATTQLAMSFATKGWFPYRDLPIYSACVWGGTLYFGTADGRVCIGDGYLDNVLLSDPNSYTPVAYSLLTAFRNGGAPTNKRLQFIRPLLQSQSPSPVFQVTAKFDFDSSEPPPPAGAGAGQDGTWDNAVWDQSVWSGDFSPSAALQGASGMGRDVAIAIRGFATSRTTLLGFDVYFDEGGLL